MRPSLIVALGLGLVAGWLLWPGPDPAPVVAPQPQPLPVLAPPEPAESSGRAASAPARGLAGVVVDRDGTPVVGALVGLVSLDAGLAEEVTTSSDGAFAIARRPLGELRLVVTAEGFLAHADAAGATERVRIALRRAPRVRVRVLDAATGASIAPFVAAALPTPEEPVPLPFDPPPGSVRSDRADPLELVCAQEGSHDVLAFAERRAPARVRVDLRADATTDVEVRLDVGIALRGRVRDHGGAPVADAAVLLRSPTGAASGASTREDGSFAFAPLPPGAVSLLVQPEALPFLSVPTVELRASEPEPFLELQLPPGCEAAGKVVPWQIGREAEVVFSHAEGPTRRVAVDPETGEFAARDLPEGVHRVAVERTERDWKNRVARALPAAVESLELRPGVPAKLEVEDVVPTLASVRGRVVGGPAADGVVVRAFGEDRPLPQLYEGLLRSNVPADGTFAIEGFLPGRWRLQVMRGDDVLAWQLVELGPAQQLEVVLRLP